MDNKHKSYPLYFLLILVALAMAGCSTPFSEVNTDPNEASEATPSLLLTAICYDAFDAAGTYDDDIDEETLAPAFATRQMIPSDRVNDYSAYTWQRGSYDDYNMLRQVTKMYEAAVSDESANYQALALFLKAYYFYELTMKFGDIPYYEALKGETEGISSPAYDTQEEIFTEILSTLDEANSLIDEQTDDIAGDIIYDGDASKWKKLINSFTLEVLISLSEKESAMNVATRFKTIVDDADTYPLMTSIDDNGQLTYYDAEGARYPDYQNSDMETGRVMSATFVDLLKERSDPRLFSYAALTTNAVAADLDESDFDGYGGASPGNTLSEIQQEVATGDVSRINSRFYDDPVTEPYVRFGYDKQQFYLAEAAYRGWIDGDASEYYEEGIAASFEFYGLDSDDVTAYLSESLVAYSTDNGLEKIIVQKYLASFKHAKWNVFYDYRRTGFPSFQTGSGTGNNATVPMRWMYPEDELSLNADNVTEAIESQFSGDDDINSLIWILK